MKKLIITTILSATTAVAFAQASAQTAPGRYQTNDGRGVNIQGNTDINAAAGSQTAVAVGQMNTANNTVGAIKRGTNIIGNTNINAVVGSQTAVAVGHGNKAKNSVGQIGGD